MAPHLFLSGNLKYVIYKLSPLIPTGDRTGDANVYDKRKMWIIRQMNEHLEAHFGQPRSNKESYERLINEKLSELADTRNGILTVIAIFGTVIIGVTDHNGPYYPWIIVGPAVSGLITYIVTTMRRREVKRKLSYIQNAYDNGYIAQNFMKGLLGVMGTFLDAINFHQLYTLHFYYVVIQGGISCMLDTKIKEIYPRELENTQVRKLYRILIENAYQMYKDHEKDLTDEQFLSLFNFSKAGLDLKNELDGYTKELIDYQAHKNNDSK